MAQLLLLQWNKSLQTLKTEEFAEAKLPKDFFIQKLWSNIPNNKGIHLFLCALQK